MLKESYVDRPYGPATGSRVTRQDGYNLRNKGERDSRKSDDREERVGLVNDSSEDGGDSYREPQPLDQPQDVRPTRRIVERIITIKR